MRAYIFQAALRQLEKDLKGLYTNGFIEDIDVEKANQIEREIRSLERVRHVDPNAPVYMGPEFDRAEPVIFGVDVGFYEGPKNGPGWFDVWVQEDEPERKPQAVILS